MNENLMIHCTGRYSKLRSEPTPELFPSRSTGYDIGGRKKKEWTVFGWLAPRLVGPIDKLFLNYFFAMFRAMAGRGRRGILPLQAATSRATTSRSSPRRPGARHPTVSPTVALINTRF